MADTAETVRPAQAAAEATGEASAAPSTPAVQPAAVAALQTAPSGPGREVATGQEIRVGEVLPPRRKRRVIVPLLLLVALGGGGVYGYRWWTVGRFVITTDDAYVQADTTTIASKVSGYIESVPVEDHQRVKQGDLLARIDDGDYKLAVDAAKGRVDTQAATLARIDRQIDAQRAAVDQARAQIDSAKAEAQRADSAFTRASTLAASDFGSKAQLDQARADRDRAQAAVKAAQSALAGAEANVGVLQAQALEAQRTKDELQTALAKAQRDLSFTEIRAPVDGVVGNRAAQVGQLVQPGTRLMAVVPLDTVRVDANFKETQLERLKPGQEVEVIADAYPDRPIIGHVESVSPASGAQFSLLPPENATGNFTKIVQRLPVRIALPPQVAEEGLLRPGMSVEVGVRTKTAADAARDPVARVIEPLIAPLRAVVPQALAALRRD
jgi:membrane fusion protein (multidrug efflux system)